jgi:RHS repeat-associated protein
MPDNEKVSYFYDTAGQLDSVGGTKSYNYCYVKKIQYDKFGQRTYLQYGNGSETTYAYDNLRRLSNLVVNSPSLGGGTGEVMKNAYTYDAVSNILKVENTASKKMVHSYSYDNLYRLTGATGSYSSPSQGGGWGEAAAYYSLAMAYDDMYRITSKTQAITHNNIQYSGTLNVGYNLDYKYRKDKKFQLDSISDNNYHAETIPNKKTHEVNKCSYDADGNLVSYITSRIKKDGSDSTPLLGRGAGGEVAYKWDECDHMIAANVNGYVSNYWYDATGERTVKESCETEQMYVNGVLSSPLGRSGGAFTLYVSPYLVATKGGNYTKHIYIGSERMVSQLGGNYGSDPRILDYAGSTYATYNDVGKTSGLVDYVVKYNVLTDSISKTFKYFDVPFTGTLNKDYLAGNHFFNAATANTGKEETYRYFYHPDHLGSTSYITDTNGDVVEHLEYLPGGELLFDLRTTDWFSKYRFTAKEQDSETGLYYVSQRYFDPSKMPWLSVDQLKAKHPNISSYAFCANNPVNLSFRL